MATLWTDLERRFGRGLLAYLTQRYGAQTDSLIGRLRLADANVLGFGYGPKRVGGAPTERASVIVFVVEKREPALVDEDSLVPDFLDDVETDVVAIGSVQLLSYRREDPPVPWGSGVETADEGFLSTYAGTFGAVVTRDAAPHLLSNAHVLAPQGVSAGTSVYHGVTNEPHDRIATLTAWVDPVPLSGLMPAPEAEWNYVDAAVARVLPERDGVSELVAALPGGATTVGWRAVSDVPEGLTLAYRSINTEGGEHVGAVLAIGASLTVTTERGEALYVNQIVMDGGRALHGDSGSVALTEANETGRRDAVGLVFAGTRSFTQRDGSEVAMSVAVLNPIEQVLALLGATLGDPASPFLPFLDDLPEEYREVLDPLDPVSLRKALARPVTAVDLPLEAWLRWKGAPSAVVLRVAQEDGVAARVANAPTRIRIPPRYGDLTVTRD